MAKVCVRSVGRPVGSSHKVPHSVRIAKILVRFGVTAPAAKVKAEITRTNGACKPENRIALDKALDVKIAQVRSKMLKEQTGVARVSVGRMTIVEKELVATKLELAKLQALVAPPVAVEVPAVEVVAEAPAVEVVVAAEAIAALAEVAA